MTNQTWNADDYQKRAAYVAQLGKSLIELLQPQAEEEILDLGCGEGTLTLELMKSGANVRGIDADPSMISSAREKGVNAQLQSAIELDVESEFDAVFSNAALHWIRPPEQVVEGVYRALKPGGRFVAEFGGAGNVESARSALVSALEKRGHDSRQFDTWYFPTAEEYQCLLESYGFEVRNIELYSRPTPIGEQVTDWFRNFANNFLAALPESERHSFIEEVSEQVASGLQRDEQGYLLDYVRLRFVAVKS
ncbi:MAG: methyltransferase domain-containing protein [Planctomycetaceae bacterium]|nr:methyltransferase domain-containing protein [Planctomycetaceae bacterium]